MQIKFLLKKELPVALYYLAATLVAVVAPYVALISGVNAINTTEAWKNVAPYIRSVLLTFVVFVVMRLLVLVLISYVRAAPPTKNS